MHCSYFFFFFTLTPLPRTAYSALGQRPPGPETPEGGLMTGVFVREAFELKNVAFYAFYAFYGIVPYRV